jgi:branched-chain amino acid transport system permease protein
VILIGVIIAVGLWIFQEKTKFGAIVRAGVDDEEMLRGSGINIQVVFTGVFGLGVSLCTSRPHPFSIIISMVASSFLFGI